jgi:hypothetical protein
MGKKIVRKEWMKERREKSVWRRNEKLDDKGSTTEKYKIKEGAVAFWVHNCVILLCCHKFEMITGFCVNMSVRDYQVVA